MLIGIHFTLIQVSSIFILTLWFHRIWERLPCFVLQFRAKKIKFWSNWKTLPIHPLVFWFGEDHEFWCCGTSIKKSSKELWCILRPISNFGDQSGLAFHNLIEGVFVGFQIRPMGEILYYIIGQPNESIKKSENMDIRFFLSFIFSLYHWVTTSY